MPLFTEIENYSKTYMEQQKTPSIQSNPEKDEQSWRNTLLDFKLYHKAVVIKTVWVM